MLEKVENSHIYQNWTNLISTPEQLSTHNNEHRPMPWGLFHRTLYPENSVLSNIGIW